MSGSIYVFVTEHLTIRSYHAVIRK